MNKCQRESVGVHEGDMISVSAVNFVGPVGASSPPIDKMTIEVRVYGQGTNIMNLKESELVQNLKQSFAGQIFAPGQKFWTRVGTTTFIYKVTEILVRTSLTGIPLPFLKGMLTAATKVEWKIDSSQAQSVFFEKLVKLKVDL